MRNIASIFAAATMALPPLVGGTGEAQAASGALANIKPFRPFSIVNEQPAICDPFLAGWTAAFDGPGNLGEDAADLAAFYPQARYFEVPYGNKPGYQSQAYHYTLSVDFDGDQEDEVLLFRAGYRGSYYDSVNLYLFGSRAEYERAVRPGEPPTAILFQYQPLDRARILEIAGRYYTLDGPKQMTGGTAADRIVSLVELNAPEKPRTVCTVRLYPEAQAFAEVVETLPLLVAARDVYGGKTSCQTLSGPADFDLALPNVLYRPWALKAPDEQGPPREADIDPTGELYLLGWGLRDPQSWQDYLEVKNSRPAFLAEMTRYYRTNRLTVSRGVAREWAEQAWRYAVFSLVNGRTPESVVFNPELSPGLVILPIESGMSPDRITRLAIDAWLVMRDQGYKPDRGIWGVSWSGLLLAAIYTRQPMETVLTIALKAEGDFESISDRNAFWNQALIAALGHNELTLAFLDRAGTHYRNAFGKTALMYAAQHDRLNAVKLLLAHGAWTDIRTDSSLNQYDCIKLERDRRTALMYAAENASAKVIDALIDAGAKVDVTDSKGNNLLWYFARNTKVTNAAERARLVKRLGG